MKCWRSSRGEPHLSHEPEARLRRNGLSLHGLWPSKPFWGRCPRRPLGDSPEVFVKQRRNRGGPPPAQCNRGLLRLRSSAPPPVPPLKSTRVGLRLPLFSVSKIPWGNAALARQGGKAPNLSDRGTRFDIKFPNLGRTPGFPARPHLTPFPHPSKDSQRDSGRCQSAPFDIGGRAVFCL